MKPWRGPGVGHALQARELAEAVLGELLRLHVDEASVEVIHCARAQGARGHGRDIIGRCTHLAMPPATRDDARMKDPIEKPCPGCGATVSVPLAAVRAGDEVTCAGCGKSIALPPELVAIVAKADGIAAAVPRGKRGG